MNIPSGGSYKINGVDITSTLKLKQSTGLTYNPANPFLFDNDYQYNNYTLTADITPTYSLTNAVALNGVSITFIGDGTHTVNFSNFTESDLSGAFDITNGAENKVIFYYDGIDVIYSVVSSAKIASSTVTGLLSNTDWTTFNSKQAALVSGTNIKTINSTTILGSGNITVQPTLVSGTNIKTINGTSVLGSGDIVISTGVTPTDNIFDWDGTNSWYAPYSSKQASMSFYTGNTNPTLTTRLNLDADLHATSSHFKSNSEPTIIYAENNKLSGDAYAFFGVSNSPSKTSVANYFRSSAGIGASISSYTGTQLYVGHNDNLGSESVSSNWIKINRSVTTTGSVTSNIIDITDNPTTSGTISGKVLSATIGLNERISLNPRFISGTVGDAYMFDTHTSISSTNSYLFNFKNNGNTAFGYKLYGSANYLFIDGQPFIGNNAGGIAYSNIRWGLSGALCSGNSSTTNPHAFYHTTASGDNNINSFLIHRNHGGAGASTGNILQIQDDNSTSGTISGALINGTILGTPRFIVNPRVTDGASAVAYMFSTHNTLSDNAARILSLKNNRAEVFYVNQNGTTHTRTTYAENAGATGFYSYIDFTNNSIVCNNLIRLNLNPNISDNASAVAYLFDTHNNLTTTGAKLASFKNQGVEKVSIDKDGQPEVTTAGSGIILKSPDGTRYKITVANGGTLTVTAL